MIYAIIFDFLIFLFVLHMCILLFEAYKLAVFQSLQN